MEKHQIDLMIERETKLLGDIREYLDNLTKHEYEHFSISKQSLDYYDFGVEYEPLLEFDEARISLIGFPFSLIEVYEKACNMKCDVIDEVIEQYLKEQILEEIKFILDEAAKPIPDDEVD